METERQRIEGPQILVLLLLVILLVLLGRIILSIPLQREGLDLVVAEHLHQSGVASPVTAVLLNFRGYDTLLEVMVLLLAALGCWSLTEAHIPEPDMDPSPVQNGALRLLTPLMIVVAAYMVWQGSHFAGGAFQSGAILASIGVLLLVSGMPWLRAVPSLPLRVGLVAGPLVFLLIAVGCMLGGKKFLQYPAPWTGSLLLLIEIVCALSIGLTLAALFAGGRPPGDLGSETIPPELSDNENSK
jgi:multisubunit Na+/H+ antiporter MnhB subunit